MSGIRLADIELPAFGLPERRPELPIALYAARLDRLAAAARAAGLTHLVLYADREHFANVAYLTGFDPRFEEALLLLDLASEPAGRPPLLLTGPENLGWPGTGAAPLGIELRLYPPFGLLGQDRSRTPPLAELLSASGIGRGSRVGVVGWKYFGPAETATPEAWLDIPSYIADALRALVGAAGRVGNAAALLMHATAGLRAVNEIEQIAQFEHAACHTSEAIRRVLFGLRPGMREFEAARLMQPIGLPLSCHPMFSSGERARFGLNSPSDRPIGRGDPYTAAFGVWGALNCRAGWVAEDAGDLPAPAADYLERLAAPYFACVVAWYEALGIGVAGGSLDALVKRHLGDPFFGVGLNPGHLIHLDEWMNTPIYPESEERLRSGQALQLDIIPATGSPWFTANVEDGLALLDASGRAALAERFPAAWQRIEHRRAFMADVIGISLRPEVLPLGNIPAYLPPFVLSPGRAFVRR